VSKKNKSNGNTRVRKLGEREESVVTPLSDSQLEEVKERVMVYLDEIDAIKDKKDEAVAQFKAEAATIKLQLETDRKLLKSRARKDMVVIEEYLTQANEVIRVRKDTGEQIGQRTATSAELQEEMFTEPADPVQPDAAPQEPELSDDELVFAAGTEFGETS